MTKHKKTTLLLDPDGVGVLSDVEKFHAPSRLTEGQEMIVCAVRSEAFDSFTPNTVQESSRHPFVVPPSGGICTG